MKKYKALVFSPLNNEVHVRDFNADELDNQLSKKRLESLKTDNHSRVIILNKRQFSNLLTEMITRENIKKLDRTLWKKLQSMFGRRKRQRPKDNTLKNREDESLISDDFLEEYGADFSDEMEEYLKTFPFPIHTELKRGGFR